MDNGRRAELSCLGRGGMNLGRVKESERINGREVEDALKKMKGGKSAGLDGITTEMLQAGDESLVKWLVRMFNVCMDQGKVPEDWRNACIVPLYKGKGDRFECGSYRGISLLSVVGKVYGRVLVERMMKCTEQLIGEEQGGSGKGEGV